jgi:hypothetical protein
VGLDKLGPLSAEAVDKQESDEGEDYQYAGGEICCGVLEFLDLIVDGNGECAGDAGNVATDHEDNPEFADGVGEGKDGGSDERHARKGESDASEEGPWRGAEDLGYFDGGAIHGGKGDDERLDGEGQAVNHRADEEAPEGEGEGVAGEGDEGSSESGCRAKTDEEIEAEDGWRKDERESHDGLRDAARNGVATGYPRGQRGCEQEKADCGEAGETQSQAECGEVHGGASLACWAGLKESSVGVWTASWLDRDRTSGDRPGFHCWLASAETSGRPPDSWKP